jgi:hypothetical protein
MCRGFPLENRGHAEAMFAMSSSARLDLPARVLRALVAGLFVAQAIASLQIWQSNRQVMAKATALAAEGYLTIPNAFVQAQLAQWYTPLAGGLFFTLSIGAGLTLAALGLAHLAFLLPGRRRGILMLALILQAMVLLRLNLDAIQPLSSLYVLLVPPVVWVLFFYPAGDRTHPRYGGRLLLTLLLPVLLLTLLWWPQKDDSLFIRIRDQLLLDNPIGQAVNDYYYRHTLSPAEVFKPLAQKTLKTLARGDLLALPDTHRAGIAAALADRDYLPVAAGMPVDLKLTAEGRALIFSDRRGHTHTVALDAFLANPGEALGAFSQRIDGSAFFRSLTFHGLLLGFPLSLYLLAYSSLALIARPIVGPPRSPWVAGVCCLLLGVAAWWPVNAGRTDPIRVNGIDAALASADRPRRLAALRLIHDRKLDIGAYPQYRALLEEGGIAERYWLARALGVSRSRATFDDLLHLTADPHPNVVCQAYYALGRKANRRAIPLLVRQLNQSRHWYAQWYGYRSLKALGWRQKPSL